MLRVRLIIRPTGAEPAKEVWCGVVAERQERQVLRQLQAYATEGSLQGEWLDFRVADGAGGGCLADGPMLRACVSAVEGGHEAEVEFFGDNWRVWRT